MKNLRISFILFLFIGGTFFNYVFFFLLEKKSQGNFIKGADISTLYEIESHGGKYFQNGLERDLLDILQENGFNWIRLRLWVDPDNYGGGGIVIYQELLL